MFESLHNYHRSTSEGKEAICRYDASFNVCQGFWFCSISYLRCILQQFTIWCSRDHGDATFFAFLSTLKDYIKVEETREKDISEMVRCDYSRLA